MTKKKKEDKKICESCLLREARIEFSREPVLALTHGFGTQHICRHCYIAKNEDAMEDIKEVVKEQKELLEKEEKNSK